MNEFTSTQPIADQLKGFVRKRGAPDQRRQISAMIQRFERCGYNPAAFADALAAVETIAFDDDGNLVYAGNTPLLDVTGLLQLYLAAVEPAPVPEIFDTKGAADYVKMSLSAFKKHVHIIGDVTGVLVGNSLAFPRAELDRFVAVKRPQGRPRKEQPAE